MIFNLYSFWFLNLVATGTILTLTSASWPGMWLGLEINMASYLLFSMNYSNKYNMEALTKYFLVQATASMFLMLSFILNMGHMVPLLALVKLGFIPFHSWMVEVNQNLSWVASFMLLTWQKLAPFSILFLTHPIWANPLSLVAAFFAVAMALPMLISQKILVVSSLFHLCWLSPLQMNNEIFFLYFLNYSVALTIIFTLISKVNSRNLNSLLGTSPLLMGFSMLVISGLPPFNIFIVKWLAIMSLSQANFKFLPWSLVIFSLIMIFIYLRMAFFSFMINPPLWNLYPYPPDNLSMLSFLLITIPLISCMFF